MGVPISQAWTVATYVLKQKLMRRSRYPLVLMLEPLMRCNLACAGCGKIQYPAHVLKSQLTPEQCFKAVEECGTPMVAIPGGEPLLHPQMPEIVAGLVARKKYVYMCTNNTIEGSQWTSIPETGGTPLVADMSSDILSRPIDVNRFGCIFAGAQKNLGPSGATVVIVRKDLAERADKNLPTVLQYRTHIKEKSLYHTPPTFAVYIVGLVLDWIEAEGGAAAIEKKNEAKAQLLYDAIDSSGGFYSGPIEKASRSKMNVTFRIAGGDEAVEKKFAAESGEAKLIGLGGHRSVGGMRASIYNAVPKPSVQTLVSFMKEFQRRNG